jgi:hypothetical protein
VLGHQTGENTKEGKANGLGSEMAQEKSVKAQTPQDAQENALAAKEITPRQGSAHHGR